MATMTRPDENDSPRKHPAEIILSVALPRLVQELGSVRSWLNARATESGRESSGWLRSVQGAEGLAALAALPERVRDWVIREAELPERERAELLDVARRLGRADD